MASKPVSGDRCGVQAEENSTPRAVIPNIEQELSVKKNDRSIDNNVVTGITVNGIRLMDLQKMKIANNVKTTQSRKKNQNSGKKNPKLTTPSSGNEANIKRYLVTEKTREVVTSVTNSEQSGRKEPQVKEDRKEDCSSEEVDSMKKKIRAMNLRKKTLPAFPPRSAFWCAGEDWGVQ